MYIQCCAPNICVITLFLRDEGRMPARMQAEMRLRCIHNK